MTNQLPEKLVLLRKNYQLSQGDIAARMNIPVTEYMKWENGSAICNVQQLKTLADMYRIPLEVLIDNTKTIVIPENPMEQSVDIPFLNDDVLEATEVVKSYDPHAITQENTKPVSNEGTKVMETADFKAAEEVQQRTYEEDDDDEEDRPSGKSVDPKKKKQTMIIMGSVLGIVVVIAAVLLVLKALGGKVNVGNDNRLASGDTYTLFVEQNGNVQIKGTLASSSQFSTAVQVSAYDSHAVALKNNGTVVDNVLGDAVKGWKNIRYIAAGKNHTVAVDDDGKVYCTGSDTACEVKSWSNISSVYAGNDITIGITNDGEVKASGTNAASVANQSGIQSAAISDNQIILAKKDGTLKAFLAGSGTQLDTAGISSASKVYAGHDCAVVLLEDGTVNYIGTDESISAIVEAWSHIRYLNANVSGNTIVAVTRENTMYGAGDNTYGQYPVTETNEEEPEEQVELEAAKNIQVSVNTANIVITWDKVENADFYEVTINTDPVTTQKSARNSVSVPSSTMTNGNAYSITVVAKNNDEEKYISSTATYDYTYEANTVQLSTPTSLTWNYENGTLTLQWNEVEHADFYTVMFDGNVVDEPVSASTTLNTEITEGQHTIVVIAKSNSEQYTESSESSLSITIASVPVTLTYTVVGGNEYQTTTVNVVPGTYTDAELDSLAGGFAAQQGMQIVSPNNPEPISKQTSSVTINVTKTESE